MITFKEWILIREQQQGSMLSSRPKAGEIDDNDKLQDQAKQAMAGTIGQPGVNNKMRAAQLKRIAQTAATKKGVKLKSVLDLAKTADELSKSNNPLNKSIP
jgi:hypothetical protein